LLSPVHTITLFDSQVSESDWVFVSEIAHEPA
jgi:hypothetical protein